MGKKMTAAEYERSSTDKKADRAGAKRRGESVKTYERSNEDAREDRKNLSKINKGRK
jgi:hypothetical protein